jgi:hypothetical protein
MTDLSAIIFFVVAPVVFAGYLVLCDRVRS